MAEKRTTTTIRLKDPKHGERTESAPQGKSPIADDVTTKGSHNLLEQSGDEPKRRPLMATDTKTGFEVMEMAKVWKEGYLKALETSLQWQQQNEQLVKGAVRQGLSAYQQWFALYKSWLGKPWDQVQGQTTGVPNQFLAFTREVLQTSQERAEPLLKTACENSFDYYETAVAGPARKYTVEINKKVMDTLIPS
jgi:hypothetical protein